ncbi:MAG: hypothetical protein IMW90_20550 [Thermogemmatispora sp.]|nr:hypothetical protein [Thermogemmatispora sp.]
MNTINPALVSYILTRTLIATVSMRGPGNTLSSSLESLAEALVGLYVYGLLPRQNTPGRSST